jgi:hypothetical protein
MTDTDVVAARRAIAEYHKELSSRLFEIESKFDNATLLVAGGAFTISAGFSQKIDATLVAGLTLAISWLMWGLCLALSVGGHLLSARCHKRQIRFLTDEKYDQVGNTDRWDRSIDPVNYCAYATLLAGFCAFGIFVYSNLTFTSASSTQEHLQNGRQEDATANSAATTSSVSERGAATPAAAQRADAHAEQGEQRSAPAAGVSKKVREELTEPAEENMAAPE